MFKAAIRVNKITSIAQLRGATLHAERADETSQARLREGAEPGAALAWSKAPQSDRDYLAAHKAHKAELGAGERKGAPLCMQALCVISPEWVKAAMMPSMALPVWRKNNWPKTRAEAVPYRKNSYHSATVPAMAAATTRLSPAGVVAL